MEEDRIASAEIIRDIVAKLDKPVIIAGDFNAEPESQAIATFSTFCTPLSDTTAMTFPANEPNRCIDYILTNSSSVKGSNPTVMEEPVASDHRPLYVDVTL